MSSQNNNQDIHSILIESAKAFLNAGLSVIPVREKLPAVSQWKSYQETPMQAGETAVLFGQSNVTGIAVVCGKVSCGLEVLDFDLKNHHTNDIWTEFWEVTENTMPGLLQKVAVTATINGGYHIYYRCDSIEGNRKLARNENNEILIETRGQGGYVIAPPSAGYQLLQGDFGSIPLITERERSVLFSVAASFDEQPLPEDKELSLPSWSNGLSPFEDYNQRGDAIGLLQKHGWQIVKQQGERIHLRRPGKKEGISGNFHSGKRLFFAFSTSTAFEAKAYNPVGVYTLLEAFGDYSRASKQLYEEGFGDRVAEKKLKYRETEKPEKAVPPLQPFPIEGFPKEVREIINSCSETFRTPRDYWAGAVLIASALGIGNKISLSTNYTNFPVLWLVLVGDVSSGKSNPMDFCLNYFKRLDGESIRKYDLESAEYNRLIKLTAREREAEGITEKPEKPECFQYILNDFTPEALVAAHKINNRGLLIERDEIKGWIDDFGRYSKSGEQSNMLSTWSGIGITYNRKTSGILNIQHPCVMVAGGMQPDLLHTLANDNRAENGFLSRLCSIYPDDTRKADYNTAVLPDSIKQNWEKYLDRLIRLNPEKLKFGENAQKLYEEWYNRNAAMINEEENGYLKGVYGKLDIISLRVAIILFGMNQACGDLSWGEISGKEMETALEITEYFRLTALKIYRKLVETEENNGVNKKTVARYLFKERGMPKIDIAKALGTSRSQVDRVLSENRA